MTAPPPDTPRPKELYLDEQWDRFIDLTIRRTVYGTLAGGAAALLLARERGPREPCPHPSMMWLLLGMSQPCSGYTNQLWCAEPLVDESDFCDPGGPCTGRWACSPLGAGGVWKWLGSRVGIYRRAATGALMNVAALSHVATTQAEPSTNV